MASVKLLLSRLRLVFDADARTGFARWWNDVHGRADAKWEADPWVWVVEFEVMPCT